MGLACALGAKQVVQGITNQPEGYFREGQIHVVTGAGVHWTYRGDGSATYTNTES